MPAANATIFANKKPPLQYLSEVPGGRVGRASVGELELVLYLVAWGAREEPPTPIYHEPESEATGPGPKRAARRKK